MNQNLYPLDSPTMELVRVVLSSQLNVFIRIFFNLVKFNNKLTKLLTSC